MYMRSVTANSSSAVDVNIYASSPRKARSLLGNHENTEVGNFLSGYLDLDLEPITQELRDKGHMYDTVTADGAQISWMGNEVGDGRRLHGMDHYHGDFKRCTDCGYMH